MKALEHKTLLEGLGLDWAAARSLVIGDLLRRYKQGMMDKDTVKCELILAGYSDSKGAVKLNKASNDVLAVATVIL